MKRITEDWLAVCLGLFLFAVSLASFLGVDALGWAVSTSVWTNPAKMLAPASKSYAGLSGYLSLALTYVFLLVLTSIGALALRLDLGRFIKGFTAVFCAGYLSWMLGSWAYIAATPDKRSAFHIGWSLNLTNEAGYIVALIVGLFIGNFLPVMAARMKEAIRPELYIKTAIVILGGSLGVTAAEQLGLATSVMFSGLCAIVCAYLIFWAMVYYIARQYFKFSREWAAPLASGISICGVSAAIATGSAIRARPVVPVMVSSLVVIFAVMEILLLPFMAQTFLSHQPMVAGAWMGLAVKTDGAAVTSGAVTDALIRAKALAEYGIQYKPGWIMGVSTTVKVFIDVFIGIWAFVLAWIWAAKIDPKRGPEGEPSRSGSDSRSSSWATWRPSPSFSRLVCFRPRISSQGQSRHGAGQRVPRYLLRHDLLYHRRGFRLPQIVAGRHRQTGAGLCFVSVRFHHLDRAGNLLGLLPWNQAANLVRTTV